MSQQKAISGTVTGDDQEVGFRAMVMKRAIEYNLAGVAKNEPNMILRFTLQGDGKRIDEAIAAINEGTKRSSGVRVSASAASSTTSVGPGRSMTAPSRRPRDRNDIRDAEAGVGVALHLRLRPTRDPARSRIRFSGATPVMLVSPSRSAVALARGTGECTVPPTKRSVRPTVTSPPRYLQRARGCQGGQQGGEQHKPGQQEQEPNRRGESAGRRRSARWRSARRATLDELTKDPPGGDFGGISCVSSRQ
jgi:acylphosphatase